MIRLSLRCRLALFSAALTLSAPAIALTAHGEPPFLSHPTASEASTEWGDDLAAALDSSSRDKLPVLLLFTGSDWCSPCKQLEKTVTDTEEFLKGAHGRVHLVRLDLPQRPGIVSKEVLLRNKAHVETFGITGYPTLLLVGSDGRPLGGFYDGERKTDSLLAACALAKFRSEYLTKLLVAAEAAKGAESTALRLEALRLIGDEAVLRAHYPEELKSVGDDAIRIVQASSPAAKGGETVDPNRKTWETLVRGLQGLSDKERIARFRPALDASPDDLKVPILQLLAPSLVRSNQAREALELIEREVSRGTTLMENSTLWILRAELDVACEKGDKAIAALTQRHINDENFSKLLAQAESAALAKDTIAKLKELKSMPLCAINAQWLRIRLGFAFEGADDLKSARKAFIEARDFPGGGVGNVGYASEQLARLDGM